MTARFEGAVAVVTGAAHGIGAAVAARLASEGASVAVLDLDVETADQVAARLPREHGNDHLAHGLDLTDGASVTTAMAAVEDRFGRLDVLANVAGGGEHEPDFEEGDDGPFERMWDLNFLGVVRMCRASVPLLRRSDRAAIVMTSSVNGLMVFGSEAYSAAKAGLSSLTTNLAMRYAPQIRVNAVAPGTIRTRVWDRQGGPDKFAPLYPMGRVGEPDDIASAIAFLASGDASWITGQMLAVDGGITVRGIHGFGS
jgi:meso-butanediol dehydrogenase/(S,S)-butanediol dehydrogenase/diacetyl reductase